MNYLFHDTIEYFSKTNKQPLIFKQWISMVPFVIYDFDAELLMGTEINVTRGSEKYQTIKNTPLNTPFKSLLFNVVVPTIKKQYVLGLVERDFNTYTIWSVFIDKSGNINIMYFNDDKLSSPENIDRYVAIKGELIKMIEHIHDYRSAEDKEVRSKSLLNDNGKKSYYKLNQIIYLTKKNHQENVEKTIKKKVEWTHSYRVMGHWRTLEPGKIGKNQEGNYIVPGFTWVKDFVKGEGELIEKIRIIK